jgi:hypothetical protein
MTWTETHERTRIIREVVATAATDMTGAVPWREEWSAYFDGPAGLVKALRSRWESMCSAQLDDRASYDDPEVTYQRLRRSEAGVLAILDAARSQVATRVLPLTGPVPLPKAVKRRIFAFHGGPVLPTSGPRQH